MTNSQTGWRSSLLVGAVVLAGCAHAPASAPVMAGTPTATPAPRRLGSFYSYEWFVRGEVLLAEGKYSAAAEAYRTALSDADEDAYLFSRLSLALDRGGQQAAAMDAVRRGLKVDPDSEAVLLAWGEIAQRHHAFEEALQAFEHAQAAAPESPDGPLGMAALLRTRGDHARAVTVLERFAAKHPAGTPLALRARLELALARDDGTALAETARLYLEQAGGDGALMRRTARQLAAQGRASLAARLLAVLPVTDDDVRLRLALDLQLAQFEQAELLLATTQPALLGGPLEIAEAYLRIEQPERALEALDEQETAEDPDPHRRSLLRGEALMLLGQPAQAALVLAKIPRDSRYAARARHSEDRARQAAGLPPLAGEATPQPSN